MDAIALVIFFCTTHCEMSVAGYFPHKEQCMAQSQPLVAQWSGEHPNVPVKSMRFSCVTPDELTAIFHKDEA